MIDGTMRLEVNLSQRELEEAIAEWVGRRYTLSGNVRVTFSHYEGDPGHYADTGPTFGASVSFGGKK